MLIVLDKKKALVMMEQVKMGRTEVSMSVFDMGLNSVINNQIYVLFGQLTKYFLVLALAYYLIHINLFLVINYLFLNLYFFSVIDLEHIMTCYINSSYDTILRIINVLLNYLFNYKAYNYYKHDKDDYIYNIAICIIDRIVVKKINVINFDSLFLVFVLINELIVKLLKYINVVSAYSNCESNYFVTHIFVCVIQGILVFQTINIIKVNYMFSVSLIDFMFYIYRKFKMNLSTCDTVMSFIVHILYSLYSYCRNYTCRSECKLMSPFVYVNLSNDILNILYLNLLFVPLFITLQTSPDYQWMNSV